MGPFLQAIIDALGLLFELDEDVLKLIRTSLRVALSSTAIAAIIGFPLGIWLGLAKFKGRRTLDIFLNTLLFLPTVLVGHLVYMLLTRDAVFGRYALLFTPYAIIIGQIILATPIVITMISNAVKVADPRIIQTALSLGAGKMRAYLALMGEIRGLVLLSIIAAFGRVISEVGISMMVGGNIFGKTRTITTGIALLTSQGEFARATALGMVLLIIVFAINIISYQATHRATA